jgi:hypothetical protein
MSHQETQPENAMTTAATPIPRTTSGRALPRVGARLHREDAPRVIELGTGRVLSGAEMAREKAAGRAEFASREVRRELAIRRLLVAVARQCLATNDLTHQDGLYLRMTLRLKTSTCLNWRRGRSFWDKKWEQVWSVARQVWADHVRALEISATKDAWYAARSTGCAPDDGEPTADELLTRIDAAAAHRVAIQRGGA